MKRKTLSSLVIAIALPLAASLFAQGDLTPPSAPAPSLKTLSQMEPRTIVNSTNTPGDAGNTFIISQPGSYYLIGNLTGAGSKNGISIRSGNVTLDLNGFAVTGLNADRGIDLPTAQSAVTIRNGTVSGWNDGGIRMDLVTSGLVENLTVTGNAGGAGLSLGNVL